MKATSSSRLISSARCHYWVAPRCQCCSLAGDRSSGLCPRHSAPKHVSSLNFREALTRDAADFQDAQGVNNSLGALYNLLAEGSISPRRASVLAYISSLLLRTLPAIDYAIDRLPVDDEAAPTQSAPQAMNQPTPQSVPPATEPLPKTAEESP